MLPISKECYIFGKRFLFEKHQRASCECSYCQEHRNNGIGSFGFTSPQDKSWNSWRIIYWVTFSHWNYIRWTWGSKR